MAAETTTGPSSRAASTTRVRSCTGSRSTTTPAPSCTFVVGTNYIATGRITGTLREFSSTSTAAGTVSTSAMGNSIVVGSKALYVGASDVSEFSNAYIGELIYYARSLSDAERDQVILYLKTAWGI